MGNLGWLRRSATELERHFERLPRRLIIERKVTLQGSSKLLARVRRGLRFQRIAKVLHTAINGTNEKEQLRNDKRSTVWCFLIVPLHLVKYALVGLTLRHVPRGAVCFFSRWGLWLAYCRYKMNWAIISLKQNQEYQFFQNVSEELKNQAFWGQAQIPPYSSWWPLFRGKMWSEFVTCRCVSAQGPHAPLRFGMAVLSQSWGSLVCFLEASHCTPAICRELKPGHVNSTHPHKINASWTSWYCAVRVTGKLANYVNLQYIYFQWFLRMSSCYVVALFLVLSRINWAIRKLRMWGKPSNKAWKIGDNWRRGHFCEESVPAIIHKTYRFSWQRSRKTRRHSSEPSMCAAFLIVRVCTGAVFRPWYLRVVDFALHPFNASTVLFVHDHLVLVRLHLPFC